MAEATGERVAYRTMQTMQPSAVDPTVMTPTTTYLYSTTGRNTKDEFNAALTELNTTGKLPSGFAMADEKTAASAFHTIAGPVRGALQDIDRGQPALPVGGIPALLGQQRPGPDTGGVGQLLGRRTPGNPEGVAGGDPNATPVLQTMIGENLSSPKRAGLFFGTMAVAPWLSPASKLAQPTWNAAKGAMVQTPQINIPGIIGNMAKTAAVSGGAGITAEAIGEGQAPEFGDALLTLGIAAAGGGVQGLMNHVVNRAVPERLRQQVMSDMYDQVVKKNPQLRNNPNALDIAASIPDQFVQMGKNVASGLRGNIDDVTTTLIDDMKKVLPLSVGTQATLRKHARAFARAGDDILENINDKAAHAKASAALNDARDEIAKLVQTEVSNFVQANVGTPHKVNIAVQGVHDVMNASATKINQLKEGAQLLNLIGEASGDKGFDMLMFRKVIARDYGNNQNQLTKDVSQILMGGKVGGPPRSINEPATYTEMVSDPDKKWLNAAKSFLPIPDRLKAAIPIGRKAATQTVLPWQVPQKSPIALNVGSQLAGQEAMREFLSRK